MRKKLFISLTTFLFLFSFKLLSQIIYVGGEIKTNTVWQSDTVIVTSDIYISEDVELKINPGTKVFFQGYYGIFGEDCIINAIGNSEKIISFTSIDTTGFYQDLESESGSWKGISIKGESENGKTSIFKYCNFSFCKNFSSIYENTNGGAIDYVGYQTLNIENSVFYSNYVICGGIGSVNSRGGAIYCRNVDQLNISKNIFRENVSCNEGGAIGLAQRCNAIIDGNTFIGNRSFLYQMTTDWGEIITGGSGGAIYSGDGYISSPIIRNNYFFNNQSGNGVVYTSNRASQIYNNVICNNIGIAIMDGHQLSTSKIYNNTIANNQIHSSGAIEIFSSAMVYNNICWDNRAVYINQPDDISVFDHVSIFPEFFNNCIQKGEGGEYSIYDDPEFINPSSIIESDPDAENADWRLSNFISPCINKGSLDTIGLDISKFDIDGNPRIFDGQVDIGAYESQFSLKIQEDPNYNIIEIFPNPTDDVLYLDNYGDNMSIFISDCRGKTILSKSIKTGQNSIDVNHFSSGVYFITVISDKNIKTIKWIKS